MIERFIELSFSHRVFFTRAVFGSGSGVLSEAVGTAGKVLVCVDGDVLLERPGLEEEIRGAVVREGICGAGEVSVLVLDGGEGCKNDFGLVEKIWGAVNAAKLDRQSYVFAIGGGAILDLVGFAAATAHRGVRHVRFPTTTLAQGDGGVGVKNGVNYFGKKNWVGSFAVPWAVVNDFAFLESLPERQRRDGVIEGIKVGLVRDAAFFEWIESNAEAVGALEQEALETLVRRSAELHVEHIAGGGDPFELGSARPLDFGHWAAHKLEQVSGFGLSHGEAVAIGMALDVMYSVGIGMLAKEEGERIVSLIEKVGFPTYAEELREESGSGGKPVVLEGLEEFREHLGGELTITLVPEIGMKVDVHAMDEGAILGAMEVLKGRGKIWAMGGALLAAEGS